MAGFGPPGFIECHSAQGARAVGGHAGRIGQCREQRNRRAWECTTKGYTYYRCRPNAKNHGHLPWFADHPPAAMVAEVQLIEPFARFFAQRVFGASRKTYLVAAVASSDTREDSELATREAKLVAEIDDLRRRQQNLINELERLQPSGDPDVDQAWRHGIQHRFASTVAEQRKKKQLLAQLAREQQAPNRPDLDVLDDIPH